MHLPLPPCPATLHCPAPRPLASAIRAFRKAYTKNVLLEHGPLLKFFHYMLLLLFMFVPPSALHVYG